MITNEVLVVTRLLILLLIDNVCMPNAYLNLNIRIFTFCGHRLCTLSISIENCAMALIRQLEEGNCSNPVIPLIFI